MPEANIAADKQELPVSTLVSFLDSMLQRENLAPEVVNPLAAVREYFAKEQPVDGPFLSVLLRTQGHKPEAFGDALLCLAAQTDQDFEVIVIDHDSSPEGAAEVARIVASQPKSFGSRVRVIEVSGGTRSRPLNAGIAAATGRFVAVYDDDDLLFGDWVEKFHEFADLGGNKLLRSQVAIQRARPEVWRDNAPGLRTLSWPSAEYPKTFDQVAHLQVNQSPFMSFAFPRVLFHGLGVKFDESLTVCEDWDVILDGSRLLGVEDIPAITAIYRRWEGGPSSYTDHSQAEWLASEQRVVDRNNATPILLPMGAVKQLRELRAAHDVWEVYERLVQSRSWRWTHPMRMAIHAAVELRVRVRSALARFRR